MIFTVKQNDNMWCDMFIAGFRCRMCCNFEWHGWLSHVLCISWPPHWNWGYSWYVSTSFFDALL